MSKTDQRPFKCFRIDKILIEQVKEQAHKDKRTLGKEIEYILEQYIQQQQK